MIVVVLKVTVVLVGRGVIMAVMQTEKQKKCGGVQGLLSRQSYFIPNRVGKIPPQKRIPI